MEMDDGDRGMEWQGKEQKHLPIEEWYTIQSH